MNCDRMVAVSMAPSTRSARPKARRFSARSRHSTTGCSHAPRPGRVADGSATSTECWTTTLRREDRGARERHPTHVLTDSILLLSTPSAERTDPHLWITRAAAPAFRLDDPAAVFSPDRGSNPAGCSVRVPSATVAPRLRRVGTARRSRSSRIRPPSSPDRGSNPAGYRSSRPSASRRGGRSGPPCRSRGTAGSRARAPGRPSATRR